MFLKSISVRTWWILLIVACVVGWALIQILATNDVPKTMEVLDPTKLQTGDVLTVSYPTMFGRMTTLVSGSVWSHTGIVYRDTDTGEVSVLEGAQYPDRRGLFKIPMTDWIRFNRRARIGLNRLVTMMDRDTEAIHQRFNQRIDTAFQAVQSNTRLDRPGLSWARMLFKTKSGTKTKAVQGPVQQTCHEITIATLQEAGVISNEYTPSSYRPSDILWKRVPLAPGHIYTEGVRVDPMPYYTKVKAAQLATV